jgi:hypothetical protein
MKLDLFRLRQRLRRDKLGLHQRLRRDKLGLILLRRRLRRTSWVCFGGIRKRGFFHNDGEFASGNGSAEDCAD